MQYDAIRYDVMWYNMKLWEVIQYTTKQYYDIIHKKT